MVKKSLCNTGTRPASDFLADNRIPEGSGRQWDTGQKYALSKTGRQGNRAGGPHQIQIEFEPNDEQQQGYADMDQKLIIRLILFLGRSISFCSTPGILPGH